MRCLGLHRSQPSFTGKKEGPMGKRERKKEGEEGGGKGEEGGKKDIRSFFFPSFELWQTL